MVDKVKPLGLEETTDGNETDPFPREIDPTQDYVSAKGITLENLDTTRIDKSAGGEIQFTDPTNSTKKVSDLLDAEQENFNPSPTDLISTKTGPAIRELRDKITTAEGFPRAGIRSTYNGTVSNGNWLGPNELMPNTPLVTFPVEVELNEISWGNQNTNVQFHIQFRTVSRTGTIFYTLTVTSTNPGYGYVSGINISLPAGSVIHAQYIDDGTNASDLDLVLWISRVS